MNNWSWIETLRTESWERFNDVWFVETKNDNRWEIGWAVTDDRIYRTTNGGSEWSCQYHHDPRRGVLRCVTFLDKDRGWLGVLDSDYRLLTTTNGGKNWRFADFEQLPKSPKGICGLYSIKEKEKETIIAVGTNQPQSKPGILKSTNGGKSWDLIEMGSYASLLVDIYFSDAVHGWVVGGKGQPGTTCRAKVRPIVLYTNDGGQTWNKQYHGDEEGEWGWKIQFLDDTTGFVSLESDESAAILRTDDAGNNWKRLSINASQREVQGVGFVTKELGWVSGWANLGSTQGLSNETTDGGVTWKDTSKTLKLVNRFRFYGAGDTKVGYAAGQHIYKYTNKNLNPQGAVVDLCENKSLLIDKNLNIALQDGMKLEEISVWNRFDELVKVVDIEKESSVNDDGQISVQWDPQKMLQEIDESVLILKVMAINSNGSPEMRYSYIFNDSD